jgi:hypothetical protein
MELIVNGRDRLRLFPNTRVTLRKQNPLFFLGDVLPADFTLPFTIPTAGNAKLLDFQHLPNAGKYPVVQDVVLSIDGGNATYTGKLQLLSATKEQYRVNLVLVDGVLQADTSIRDLVSGEVNMHEDFEGLEPQDVNALVGWPNAKYCLPGYINDHKEFQKKFINYSHFSENVAYSLNDLVLYNDVVYVCKAPHFGGWDEDNFRVTHAYVNRTLDGFFHTGMHPGAVFGAKYPMALFMYLCQVIKDVLTGTGYDAKGDLFDDAFMRHVIVWNNFILDWGIGNGIVTNYSNLLPDMNLRQFLNAIRDFFAVRVVIDDVNRVVYFDMLKNIRTKFRVLDWNRYIKYGYDIEFDGITGITLSQNFEHDDYPGEVIGKVRHNERFAAGDVTFRNALPDTPSFGSFEGRFVYERLSNAYIFFDEDFGRRQTKGYLFDDAVQGDGSFNLNPGASTLPMFLDLPEPDANPAPGTVQLLPRVKHLWSDKGARNPFGLRFLYYAGDDAKQIDASSNYPYATSMGIKPLGAPNYVEAIDGDMSPEGMFNRNFKYVYEWLKHARSYNAEICIPKKQFVFDERAMLRFNDLNYVWKELELELGDGDYAEGKGVFVRG